MSDKRGGRLSSALKGILYLLSLGYAVGIFIRKIFYRFGIFRTNKVLMKVVSVGNLTLGGTGKTPFVMNLAKILKDDLKKEPVVLIRGYGWDEQAMLKKALANIPVIAGKDRVRSSRRAIKLYGSDTAVLDDGFQYWELERDLDIVLIDSRNPFGNGYLFPRGILREAKDSIERADIVVFTKVNKKTSDIDIIKDRLKDINGGVIFLEAMHRPKYFYDIRLKKTLDLSCVIDKRVILLSSIGDPDYFEETIKDLRADVAAHIKFDDHHNYSQRDIEYITKICGEKNFDLIITTEKDAVKLNRLGLSIAGYPLMALSVEMDITSGREDLIAGLHSLYNS